MFGDGSQGALNVTSGITYLPLNTKLQYTTVNVGASGTIRPSGTTGSVLYICATESITINGTINVRDIVNYGNNTWGVTIDGQSFTSPGVASGGNGRWFTGSTQALQSSGFGGGGSGVGTNLSGTLYRGGNGGNGSTSPSGGSAISVSRSSNGTSATRRDAARTNGGSGVAVAYRAGALASGSTSATGGSGGQGYGADGAAGSGSNSGSSSGSWSYYWYGAGGGGAGGRAGRAGIHVVLKSPTVIINGTINTSGTNGTNGGNGGRSRNSSGWRDHWGLPGGGGGGGNAGEIQVTYNTTFTDNGTYLQTGGSGGSGGIGGAGNAEVGFSGTNGLANGLASTLIQPIVDFTANVTYGGRPLTVSFTNKSSGGDTYLWDFGDGTTSAQVNPTKVYSTVGTFTVSLKATNSAGEATETKTGFITTTINEFIRSVGGTIKMGGGITSRIVTFVRSIGGTIVMGGGVRAVLVRDAEALQSKTFLYKVYEPDGTFVEAWRDVISEPSFTHEINSAGSTMTVELARNSDSLGQVVSPLLTEDGQPIQTEDGQTLLATTTTRNQIGDDSSVNYNNRVDIVVFYGVVEPLYTEDMQVILTEDGEPLLAGLGAPNGRRIFTGFISEINSRYGNSETTIVQLTSYGWDLDQYPITTSGGATTVPFLSKDPSQIVKDAVDKFRLDSSVPAETNHSTNPSFETGSGTVEVRRNYFTNPALTGTGTLANGLALYTWQGGTGNTSLSAGVQTVTATGLTTLGRRYGVYVSPGVTASQGQSWTVSFDVNTISVPSGVTLRCFIVFSGPGNEYHEEITSVGRYSQTATAPAGTTGVSLYVYLQAAAPWTGTASFSFSKVMFEQIGAVLPYFDGSTNDGFDTASLTPAWTGTANNSASVLNGTAPVGGYMWNGTVTPAMWLSSDSPNHGSNFMRTMVMRKTDVAFAPIDTSGVTSGELITAISYVRASKNLTIDKRWRTSTGANISSIGPSSLNTDWQRLSATANAPANNVNMGIFISQADAEVGDIIDIDNHMVVKGNYTGDYFDGNSQNAQWNGAPNASTSSLLKSQTYTTRNEASISNTGTTVSYTFRANTYKEVLDKSLELMPSNWYYRIGLGDNVVYFRERPTTPQHLFYLGKHIKALDLRGSILDVVNHTLFTGGGEPALYVQRKEAPAPRTRRGLEIKSDSRVTVPLSAQIISDGLIENGNKIQYRTTVEVLSGQYDIESIQPGDLVGFRNFGNYVDYLTMQVVGLTYNPDFVQIILETKPPTISKRLEDVVRQLTVTENQNIPGSPS